MEPEPQFALLAHTLYFTKPSHTQQHHNMTAAARLIRLGARAKGLFYIPQYLSISINHCSVLSVKYILSA